MGGLFPTIRPPSIYKQGNAPDQQSGQISPIPWTDDLWVDTVNHLTKRCTAMNPYVWVSIEGSGSLTLVFNRGAAMLNPTVPINIIAWQAPVACTVTNVRGYQDIGTGSTFNARKNGSLTHLASDGTIGSAATWIDGGAVQNTAYSINDKLEVMITGVAGSPTQIAILVDYTQP